MNCSSWSLCRAGSGSPQGSFSGPLRSWGSGWNTNSIIANTIPKMTKTQNKGQANQIYCWMKAGRLSEAILPKNPLKAVMIPKMMMSIIPFLRLRLFNPTPILPGAQFDTNLDQLGKVILPVCSENHFAGFVKESIPRKIIVILSKLKTQIP